MKTMTLAAITLMLLGGAAIAQPRDDRRDDHRPGPPPTQAPATTPRTVGGGPGRPDDNFRSGNRPVVNARPDNFRPNSGPGSRPGFNAPRTGFNGSRTDLGRPGAHHLPPGVGAPRGHDRAPMWRGRSWAVGDLFVFSGFHGPSIYDFGAYGLPPARSGTHWIYVDGWYLMVGNRSGRIFDEVPADY